MINSDTEIKLRRLIDRLDAHDCDGGWRCALLRYDEIRSALQAALVDLQLLRAALSDASAVEAMLADNRRIEP